MTRIRANLFRPWTLLASRRFARGAARPETRQGRSGELAWASGLFFSAVPMERWNSDDLIARHGAGIYRKMLHDDQLRALLALKQALIAARPWRFEGTDNSPGHARCTEFFRFVLDHQLEGTFGQALQNILNSQARGFSLTEKVHARVTWQGRTYWGLRALKLRPPESFTFETDAHGNRTGIVQEQAGRRVPLPPERFIHHVNKPEVDAQYGESDLRECYRHWFAKENILKFWNIYLERLAAGFVHGRVSGPLTPSERDDLKQVLRNLSAQTSIVTPASVELSMVQAPSTDAFERAVAARDKAMAKALLVPNLLGFSEQGQTGSYSQSRTQFDTFLLALNWQAENLADTLNEQLFRELAQWNFGLGDPPRFAFDPFSAEQKREAAQTWAEAVQSGIVTQGPADESRTRELLGYPPPPHHPPPLLSGEGAGGEAA
jgi:hypothetical protein